MNFSSPSVEEQIPSRDSKVLKSLASIINGHQYITENQSQLLMRILRENSHKIKEFTSTINEALANPKWSREFRKISEVKKFYIEKNFDQELSLSVEFTFNSEIRKLLAGLTKNLDNAVIATSGKSCTADLTENNIVTLYEALSPLGFEIDDTIKSHYDTIKSWSKTEVENQFLLTNIEHKNFQKVISDDLGIETAIDQNIINDRSMRYQYYLTSPQNFGENLTEQLANRTKPRLYVDKNQHQMSEVIASIIDLKRLPLLVVFDTLVNNKYLENLKILSESLEENGIFNKIGVYFRLTNDDAGKNFNQYIATKSYNYPLSDDTNVACVMSGKLPKFFLKNAWRPMSVVALDSRMGMRHGKTAVYSNCCDLIIEWADEPTTMDIKKILV